MRRLGPLASAGIAGLLVTLNALSAQGGYMTQTVSTSPGGTKTDFSLALSVATFNPNLGTLQGVTVSFTDSGMMQGWIHNTANKSESFQVIESSTFALSLNSQQLLSNTLSAQQSCPGMGAGETGNFSEQHASGSSTPMSFNQGAMFEAFLSSSPMVTFNFASLTSTTTIGGGGNASTGITTLAWATVSVTYNYISPSVSVPEPSSLALTLAGVLAVSAHQARWVWSRRRR